MKIAPKLIESSLAHPDPSWRAALFFGPDAGLVRDRAKRLAALYLRGDTDPMAKSEFNESALLSDPARLADELSAISMLSPRRVIEVRDTGDKFTKVLEGAESSFNDSVLLILYADELSTRSSLRAYCEKHTAIAAFACYHDEARDVGDLVRKTLDAAGVRIDRDTADYLVQQLGNDRYVTYQELEKLITFAGDAKTLRFEDVRALVDYNRETGFDDVVNAVADRNLAALEKHLTLLLQEGMASVAIIRALLRYFNKLYLLQGQVQAGAGIEQVIDAIRPPVFFRQKPIMTRHLQSWKLEAIARALHLLINAELACKTSDLPAIPASGRRLLQVTQAR